MADATTSTPGGEQKKRKRLKKVCSDIRKQMEFYFSDANLHKDRFLKKVLEQTSDGFVDLDVFSNFNRLRALTTDMSLVAKALSTSAMLKVSDDGKKVKRVTELRDMLDVDERTVYVEGLPATVDHDWVRQIFTGCGSVVYVSLPKYRSTGDIKGFAFVEFDTVDAARKACETWKQASCGNASKSARFPRGNKQMLLLQKQAHARHIDGSGTTDHGSSRLSKKHRQHRRTLSSGDEECEGDPAQRSTQKRTRAGSVEHQGKRSERKDANTDGDVSLQRSTQKRTHNDSVDENSVKKRSTQECHRTGSPNGKKSTEKSTDDEGDKNTQNTAMDEVCADGPVKLSTQKRTHRESLENGDNPEKRSTQKRSHSEDDGDEIPQKRTTTEDDISHKDMRSDKETLPASVTTKEGLGDKPSSTESGEKRKRQPSDAPSHQPHDDGDAKRSKKVRISSDVKVVEVGVTRKKRKRRPAGAGLKTSDMMSTSNLRVMAKSDWLKLKKQYLQLQKESFHHLKESLLDFRRVRQQVEENLPADSVNVDKDLTNQTSAKTDRTIEFVPNVILKVTSTQPIIRKDLKSRLNAEVAYIDVIDGDCSGHIRFHNCDNASTVSKLELDGVKFELLTDTAETDYWSKLAADRERKLNTKATSKSKRGRSKVAKKADKITAEISKQNHVFFQD